MLLTPQLKKDYYVQKMGGYQLNNSANLAHLCSFTKSFKPRPYNFLLFLGWKKCRRWKFSYHQLTELRWKAERNINGLGFNVRWFFFYPKFFDIESKKCKDIQESKSYEPIDASSHHIDFDEAIETGIL